MNVPRSKPLVRHGTQKQKPEALKKMARSPMGTYASGLHNPEIASLVGYIVTSIPQIEESMIDIMAILLGGSKAPARQVFRSLHSEDARVKVMLSLLERSPLNSKRGPEFDEAIALFNEVKGKRNSYAHGLWYTHETGRTFLAEPSTEEKGPLFLTQREIRKKELEYVLARMKALMGLSLSIIYPEVFDCDGKALPSVTSIKKPTILPTR